jgi:hypothetical protein
MTQLKFSPAVLQIEPEPACLVEIGDGVLAAIFDGELWISGPPELFASAQAAGSPSIVAPGRIFFKVDFLIQQFPAFGPRLHEIEHQVRALAHSNN